ncbi:tetratricopeptide repeat protein [Syntrophotalea acetylenica]|uniref:tetratricopeptide repeat protein n=1 Tax=Syntrophotalea acetylenica TaxID=29542 RepID=UPI0009F88280|nr:tetratricopeptide repeat protein [Syntrophotalea acetylenica]MDY0261725.1 tetratricopeptide repeat protein [Syntrophotalea acetylenica]
MELARLKKNLLKEEKRRTRKTWNSRYFCLTIGLLGLLTAVGSWYGYRAWQEKIPGTLLRRAEKLVEKQRYQRAISQLRSLHEHYPRTAAGAKALLLAGDIMLLHLHREQEALLAFLLVERDYPETPWCDAARRQVADIYKYHLKDYGRALVSYQKMLDSQMPQTDHIQYEIADTYFRMNNFEQARIEFEILLADYPQSKLVPQSLYQIGSSFFLEGKTDESEQVLNRLCREYPQNSFALEGFFTLAQVHEERGDLHKALQILEKLKGRYARKAILDQRSMHIRQRLKKKNKAI